MEENLWEDHISGEEASEDPFIAPIAREAHSLEKMKTEEEELTALKYAIDHTMISLETLSDLTLKLRAQLLSKATKQIEHRTNNILDKYFDGEFRVEFSLEGDDNLTISITRNGNSCNFTQLSKGQRQLLKLSFAVSVMDIAANEAGIFFHTLFFDEALDGLSPRLKIQSFQLFEELNLTHETLLLIEHSPEFQNLFNTKFNVSIENDKSTITNV
jgi:DNA repair exonuclease SbcCD ATPase subunit